MKKIMEAMKTWQKSSTIRHGAAKMAIALAICLPCFSHPVYASDAIITKVNSIYTLVVGIVAAAGAIVLAWGIFEFATAYQSHDSSTQTQALKKVVSGIIMCAASSLITLLK